MIVVDKHTEISKINFLEGSLILVDKPFEWSSFSVVNKIRWVLRHHYGVKKIKVGHGGTLDPLATGLLLIFTGPYTKKIEGHMGMDKGYSCTIKLGAQTATYDAEAPEENLCDASHISLEMIEDCLSGFIGNIEQEAPIYSALKVDGQPMYKLARAGRPVEKKKRNIVINDIQLISFNPPFIKLNLHCSKGTYIRSIAHDVGQKLGVGGYLTALERTSIGPYLNEHAISIDEFVHGIKIENVSSS